MPVFQLLLCANLQAVKHSIHADFRLRKFATPVSLAQIRNK